MNKTNEVQPGFLPKAETLTERVILAVLFGAAAQILDDYYQFVEADAGFDGGEFSRSWHNNHIPKKVEAAQDFIDDAWRYSPEELGDWRQATPLPF